jgi:hypothetical protein
MKTLARILGASALLAIGPVGFFVFLASLETGMGWSWKAGSGAVGCGCLIGAVALLRRPRALTLAALSLLAAALLCFCGYIPVPFLVGYGAIGYACLIGVVALLHRPLGPTLAGLALFTIAIFCIFAFLATTHWPKARNQPTVQELQAQVDAIAILNTYKIGETTLDQFYADKWNARDPYLMKYGIIGASFNRIDDTAEFYIACPCLYDESAADAMQASFEGSRRCVAKAESFHTYFSDEQGAVTGVPAFFFKFNHGRLVSTTK